MVKYALPEQSNIKIEIFNMKGQLVQQFNICNNQSSVIWKAEGVPNGIYNAKLIIGNRAMSARKVIVLK